ncbi:helix-turn-helix domain-containing protein [Atlantibacter hermannii]|uniref:helix-turn-helix domain-containing protein n=1 Tax=Atlantibacter hermannii TaxID=565 RepID=UPI0035E45C7E
MRLSLITYSLIIKQECSPALTITNKLCAIITNINKYKYSLQEKNIQRYAVMYRFVFNKALAPKKENALLTHLKEWRNRSALYSKSS